MPNRNDARLWAQLCEEFHAAGATSPEARGRHARRAVALVRRERTTSGARTFAPGRASSSVNRRRPFSWTEYAA